jgi:hypothetical protein
MINLLTKKMCPFLRFLSAMAQHQLPLDVANEPGQASIFFETTQRLALAALAHQTLKSETAVNVIPLASKIK